MRIIMRTVCRRTLTLVGTLRHQKLSELVVASIQCNLTRVLPLQSSHLSAPSKYRMIGPLIVDAFDWMAENAKF